MVRITSLGPAQTDGDRITQGCEYQQGELTGGHLTSLPVTDIANCVLGHIPSSLYRSVSSSVIIGMGYWTRNQACRRCSRNDVYYSPKCYYRLEGRERCGRLCSRQAYTGDRWTRTQCRDQGQGTWAFPVWGEKRFAYKVEEILCLVGFQRQSNRESLGLRIMGGPTDNGPGALRGSHTELPYTSQLWEEG